MYLLKRWRVKKEMKDPQEAEAMTGEFINDVSEICVDELKKKYFSVRDDTKKLSVSDEIA